jgi:hypothetical protein
MFFLFHLCLTLTLLVSVRGGSTQVNAADPSVMYIICEICKVHPRTDYLRVAPPPAADRIGSTVGLATIIGAAMRKAWVSPQASHSEVIGSSTSFPYATDVNFRRQDHNLCLFKGLPRLFHHATRRRTKEPLECQPRS